MGWLTRSLSTSIGKKTIQAITGLLLILFLIVHFAGNYTIWGGETLFTAYVSTLESLGWFTHIIEILLALVFIIHIYVGLLLAWQNYKATPNRYSIWSKNKIYKSSELIDFSARYTWQTGVLVLIFLLVHLFTFWYQFKFNANGRELYEIVVDWFKNPIYSAFYILLLITLAVHISHGFKSAFQTFGWNHPKYTPWIEKFSTFLAWLFGVGFSLIPVYFYFISLGGK